jgi:hypothetical protein
LQSINRLFYLAAVVPVKALSALLAALPTAPVVLGPVVTLPAEVALVVAVVTGAVVVAAEPEVALVVVAVAVVALVVVAVVPPLAQPVNASISIAANISFDLFMNVPPYIS